MTEKKESTATKIKKKAKKTAKKRAKKKTSGRTNQTLIIVESPAKAKTLNKYLGKKAIIEASMGHIIDLPKSRMAIDVENNFQPEYITVRGRAPILNKLKKLSSRTKSVLLAPDPDREGEAISWHLKNALEKHNPNIKRIVFNEITKDAVLDAVEHPREINMSRVNAQQGRRVLDRLVGYNVSPLLWKKVKKGLSAGRVQSVALKQICDREREIENFRPEEYWTLDAKLKTSQKKNLLASLSKIEGKKAHIPNEKTVKKIMAELDQGDFTVRKLKTQERKRRPTAPYTTSKLQQDGSTKLGFTGQKTMSIAQQLYEGIDLGGEITGLITYMRTDSTRISDQALSGAREFIGQELGPEYLPEAAQHYKTKKGSQDAHEAIRPTNPSRRPEDIRAKLSRDQYRLYEMIWQKFISSQMTPEVTELSTADIENGRFMFRASGSRVLFPGFTKVFQADKKAKKDRPLPALEEGEKLSLTEYDPAQHFTQPPPRFNDASLVKTLEESGVGRPSTYAPTLATLLKRFYVTRVQKQLKPTELGFLVNKIISENFPDLVNVNFTARMEENLDKVEDADLDWRTFIADFFGPFSETVSEAMENVEEMRTVLDVETEYDCEKCGRKMVKRIGRYGYFLACPGFPECKNAKPLPLGKCPDCGDGLVVQRATKKGRPFFGCNRYPECEFSTWDKPLEGQECPDCGKLLFEKMTKESGRVVYCADEKCGYTENERESAKAAGEE